jgi:hypothetical protein
MAFRFTLPLGLASVLIFIFLVDIHAAVKVGLAYAFVGGIAFTLSDWIATPVQNERASTPLSTLRSDRTATAVHVLAVGGTNVVALTFAFGVAPALTVGLAFAIGGGLGTYLQVPLPGRRSFRVPFGFTQVGSAWMLYVLVKSILVGTSQLPPRLMAFLDDCYRLGLLRREGDRYQFRHVQVQRALESAYYCGQAVIAGVIGPLESPKALIVGRYDTWGKLRTAKCAVALSPLDQEQLKGALDSSAQVDLLGGRIESYLSFAGHRGRRRIPYFPVDPNKVVELRVDTGFNVRHWKSPPRFIRLRSDLEAKELQERAVRIHQLSRKPLLAPRPLA